MTCCIRRAPSEMQSGRPSRARFPFRGGRARIAKVYWCHSIWDIDCCWLDRAGCIGDG